jgi:hypothetical protein
MVAAVDRVSREPQTVDVLDCGIERAAEDWIRSEEERPVDVKENEGTVLQRRGRPSSAGGTQFVGAGPVQTMSSTSFPAGVDGSSIGPKSQFQIFFSSDIPGS